jgi:RNA polymerase subunit RPABC4/transcription elongation factor Spt4
MFCANCQAFIPAGEYRCPECGESVLQPEPETDS